MNQHETNLQHLRLKLRNIRSTLDNGVKGNRGRKLKPMVNNVKSFHHEMTSAVNAPHVSSSRERNYIEESSNVLKNSSIKLPSLDIKRNNKTTLEEIKVS